MVSIFTPLGTARTADSPDPFTDANVFADRINKLLIGTGWRDVAPSNGWTATGLQIKRCGDRVILRHRGLNGAAATSVVFLAATGMTSYFPTTGTRHPIQIGGGSFAAFIASAAGVSASATTATTPGGEWQYQEWDVTGASWPGTLPGTAAP